MDEPGSIARAWESKVYSDLSSYTTIGRPILVQKVAQLLLRESVALWLRQFTGPRQFRRAIDLACGDGEWTVHYLEFADTVVGVDVNASFLGEAARKAKATHDPARLTLTQANVVDFADYAQADLVCLGSFMQYLSDSELEDLFEKIAQQTAGDAILYVRATVTKPMTRAYRTKGAYYRKQEAYELLFMRHGFEVVDCVQSSTLIAREAVSEALGLGRGTFARRAVSLLLEGGVRALRLTPLGERNMFVNWIVGKRGATRENPS